MKHLMFAGPVTLALFLTTSCKKENNENAGSSDGNSNASKILRFSAIPDENTTEQTAKFKKFAERPLSRRKKYWRRIITKKRLKNYLVIFQF